MIRVYNELILDSFLFPPTLSQLVEKGDLGNSKEIEKWLDQYRSGKVFAYGQSIQGAPVAIINVKHHFTKGQPPETMHKFVAFSMETYRLMLVPPSDKVVLFFNLDGFGLKNMDWSAILYILKCLEAYFPESLHTLVIYKAPWIFSGIWKILGPMLDPVVRSKVVFMSKPSECEHLLPADRLIEQLGGDVEFNWEKRWVEPEDSENTIQEEKKETEKRKGAYMDLAKEYEDVTRKWFGGDSSEKLLTQRKTLVKKLRLARLEADPYLRGKTQLHREGTLDGQGKVTWLYETKNGETVRHIIGRRDCAAVLQRELKELEEGKSIKDVEKTTSDALENDDWNKLYGSEEVARQVEGSRVDGETPSVPEDNSKAIMVLGLPAGESSGQASGDSPSDDHEKGDEKGEKKAKSSGKQQNKEEGAAAAGGAAAGGGAAAAAASSGGGKDDKQDFVDAPEASKKTVDKAENRDHVAAPKDEEAAEKSTPEYPDQSNGSAANGNAKNGNGGDSSDSSADNGDKSSLKGSVKDKTSAGKDKISSLGSKFKGMLKKN